MTKMSIRRLNSAALALVRVVVALVASSEIAGAEGARYAYTRVSPPGALWTTALGVNNAGVVVGTFQDANSRIRGFRYEGGAYTTVDYPNVPETWVYGINEAGDIVGTWAMQVG